MPSAAAASLSLMLVLAAACGSGGPSFCERAEAMSQFDPRGDDLGDRVERALEGLDELAETAPGDVADDVATVRRGVERLARGEGVPGRDYAEASARVRDAIEEECS